MGPQAAVLNSPTGRIACRFHARDLHLVMGPSRGESQVRFRASIDGQPPGSARGADIEAGGDGTIVEQRLYQLIRQPKPIGDRRFEVEFLNANVEAFTFTLGDAGSRCHRAVPPRQDRRKRSKEIRTSITISAIIVVSRA
jgi:Thioredoxin like C-terminal domain